VRGGSWYNGEYFLRATYRAYTAPAEQYDEYGEAPPRQNDYSGHGGRLSRSLR
jgi:hypothetical protein